MLTAEINVLHAMALDRLLRLAKRGCVLLYPARRRNNARLYVSCESPQLLLGQGITL
jgi:hypothetical protein